MNTMYKIFLTLALAAAITTAQGAKTTDTTIIIKNFTVYEKDDNYIFEWSMDSTFETNYWKVECLNETGRFTSVGYVLGSQPGKGANQFVFKEKIKKNITKPKQYRLCHINTNGNIQYSQILTPAK